MNNYFRVTKPSARSQPAFKQSTHNQKSSQSSLGQVILNQKPVQVVDLTEAGPKRQDINFYSTTRSSERALPSVHAATSVRRVMTRRASVVDLAGESPEPTFLGIHSF